MHIKIMDPPLDEAIPTVAPGVRLGMSVGISSGHVLYLKLHQNQPDFN